MKPTRSIFVCIALLAMLIVPAVAADGIPKDASFKIPFQVSGALVPARAVVVIDAAGVATLRINYLAGDSIEESLYTIARKDGPSPGPTPNPDPDPKPTVLWGIVIEESAERTAPQAAVLASPRVRSLFGDGEFRVLDDDADATADMKPYVERSKGQTLPVLYLVDPSGAVYYEGPLPGTVEAMEALVAKHKAKGGAQ